MDTCPQSIRKVDGLGKFVESVESSQIFMRPALPDPAYQNLMSITEPVHYDRMCPYSKE